MKKPKNRTGVVYSTDPGFSYADEGPAEEPGLRPWDQQKFRVGLDKSGRAGKTVTLIEGFSGPAQALEELARELKNTCGTGGSAKDGLVLIQGDVRTRVAAFLEKKGSKVRLMA